MIQRLSIIKAVILSDALLSEHFSAEFLEKRSIVVVIWLFFIGKVLHALNIGGKLRGHPDAKELSRCAHLFLHDNLILLMLGLSLGPLPGQLTLE